MIYSTNKKPSLKSFEMLCQATCDKLNEIAGSNPEYFCDKHGVNLEPVVEEIMNGAAEGTLFAGTIVRVGGQKFPDIVAAKYYGVEVKSTKNGKWETVGGSVAEGTRIDGIGTIFLIFGKLKNPISFKTRPYQDCLSDIAVTHSPRYKINMELEANKTIFDKMGIKYDDLRKSKDPLAPVIEYYKSRLKKGERLWWLSTEESYTSMEVKLFNSLEKAQKDELVANMMAFFPEVFSNRHKKYHRCSLWLASKYGIATPNFRDFFSASGRRKLADPEDGRVYEVSQVLSKVFEYRGLIKGALENADIEELTEFWGAGVPASERLHIWKRLVKEEIPKAQEAMTIKMLDIIFDDM